MTKLEKMIWNLWPVSFLVAKSKQLVIPGFQGLPLYDVIVFFFRQVKKVGLNERAAAISFNLVMAMPAALLFLFSLVPYFPRADRLNKEILSLFKDISPNTDTYLFISSLVNDMVSKDHTGIFSFGFLVLIFYSSNAMMGVIRTFDKSIQEQQKTFFFEQRLRAIRITFILIILIVITTFALLIGREQLIFVLKNVFGMKSQNERLPWWNVLRWIIIVALLFYGTGLVYKFAPSVRERWKILSPGAILATTLTLITIVLFSYWVNNFANYNKIYGPISTILIIMLLMYINSLILLIGFELNVSIAYLTKEAGERMKNGEFNSINTVPENVCDV